MLRSLKQRGGWQNKGRVGKTREKLAELLTKLAREKWGPEYECWPEDLGRNNPTYASARSGGVSWDGYVRKNGDLSMGRHVHAWQSMGSILKSKYRDLSYDGELIAGDKP